MVLLKLKSFILTLLLDKNKILEKLKDQAPVPLLFWLLMIFVILQTQVIAELLCLHLGGNKL
jgi:hypothetical protein